MIVMTRYPVPGRAKTRLSPVLGDVGAAKLSSDLSLHCIRRMHAAAASGEIELEVRYTGANAAQMREWVSRLVRIRQQAEGDLGERLADAMRDAFAEKAPAAVAVGSDAPGLGGTHVRAALEALAESDVVFGPATDGGYYLVGVRSSAAERALPALFASGVGWGTSTVLEASLAALKRASLTSALLEPLADVDRPEDLQVWEHVVSADENTRTSPAVSVVIPALNEEELVADAVSSALAAGALEVIVADGGSRDETAQRAAGAGAKVLHAPRGRTSQLNAGARHATGDVLLFLHADSRLPQDGMQHVKRVLHDPAVALGAFRFEVGDQNRSQDRLITLVGRMRHKIFHLPYGDQAPFLRRRDFEDLGGFAMMPVMEDYDLALRCKRLGRLGSASVSAPGSSRAWREHGLVRVTLTYMAMIAGYRLGVPISRLAALHARLSSKDRVSTHQSSNARD
ncbi:MAG: TIGR04283 family arsenosugar biosynthesis glycosyltransferase [Coriobacteriia bacterium]|nr:TIGR04283 family arsenosugar biosynthesis glycosyltransferase [Coriobacteriia bacterium]MBN2822346.1 TIGR04283 family arsenosugar biosynthesis glycosyltransferase [Coriobacteriia bacterium]